MPCLNLCMYISFSFLFLAILFLSTKISCCVGLSHSITKTKNFHGHTRIRWLHKSRQGKLLAMVLCSPRQPQPEAAEIERERERETQPNRSFCSKQRNKPQGRFSISWPFFIVYFFFSPVSLNNLLFFFFSYFWNYLCYLH